ncbi:serine hydrolase [Vibrio tubiashii]|uniref:6-aminohexanoate hydrolase n=1 Tax=Vibrio tubiashii ATCC 19109 TaxID=1051646 RepID=F9T6E7_9VIBR|nr:serine hydrolase [Vibrio tubiashii]AIW16700.1 6-aminohexanoate hydrolase [Vibrio tubiashii ATCC 19109]EGU54610.1 6-aminohexanoate-dimer hydrolase [Vibrio tubiashii ATCC 19109]EIF02046.1 6-aminohexanoate-dimer hydrolase [Vibrio tubiashii NCIMB 1337 = ATCC 19106]
MKKQLLAMTIATALASFGASATFDLDGADRYKTAAELGIMEGLVVDPDKQVTKANALQTPPYNRWAYQNMRMFYPTADIEPAEQAIDLERKIDKSIKNIKVDNGAGDMRTFDEFMTETWGDSIVVIKGDKVVYEDYRNGMTKDTPHQMMSVTKSFGGLMALMAIDAGKVNEHAPITDYVPELKGATAFDGATVQQVLDMTNSMDFSEVYDDPKSGIRTYGAVLGWTEKLADVNYPTNLYGYLQTLQIDKEHKHGEIFHYQTPKTDVVNWITNRANGETFQDAMQEQLWSKLGTSGETYVLLDDNATLVAGGGLNATPDNLAKFATMMLNDGVFNGEQVVPKAVVDQLSAGGDRKAFGNGPDASDNMPAGEWSYRGQWWVKHTPGAEAFMAIGIHGQWIYIDRDRDVAIVKQSSAPDSVTAAQELYDLNGLDAIVKHVSK